MIGDSGEVKLGTKLSVAYFDQLRAQLNEEANLYRDNHAHAKQLQ